MQGLKVLDLQDNAIATIQSGAFSKLPSLEMLRLNSSRFLCDCQLKWLPSCVESNSELAGTVDLNCGHPDIPEALFGLTAQQMPV